MAIKELSLVVQLSPAANITQHDVPSPPRTPPAPPPPQPPFPATTLFQRLEVGGEGELRVRVNGQRVRAIRLPADIEASTIQEIVEEAHAEGPATVSIQFAGVE
jgi:hypothetical protein